MLRIAVIGAGRIGQVHARTVVSHPDATLSIVCDPIGTAAAELAGSLGARPSQDAAEVFADPEIDAVIIGSPSPHHAEQVLAAARAEKAVLCEKPVAIDVAEARRLEADLAGFDHPPVMVGFQRRFDPSMRRARELIEAGEIGRVEQVSIVSRDPAPPPASYIASSGGVFKDSAIHDFDLTRFYMGEIASVTAVGQNLIPELADTGDFDGTAIIVTATSGAVATITISRHCATGYDQRIEIHGQKGSLSMDNLRPTALSVNTAEYSAAREPYLDYFLERYADAYRNELTTFIDAINQGTPVSPTVADGIAALVLAEAADESARTGRTVSVSG